MMAFSNQLRNMAGALVMLFLAIGLNHGTHGTVKYENTAGEIFVNCHMKTKGFLITKQKKREVASAEYHLLWDGLAKLSGKRLFRSLTKRQKPIGLKCHTIQPSRNRIRNFCEYGPFRVCRHVRAAKHACRIRAFPCRVQFQVWPSHSRR